MLYGQDVLEILAVVVLGGAVLAWVVGLSIWQMCQQQQVVTALVNKKQKGGSVLDGVSNLMNAKAASFTQQTRTQADLDRLLMETAARGMGVSTDQIRQWMVEGRITISPPKS